MAAAGVHRVGRAQQEHFGIAAVEAMGAHACEREILAYEQVLAEKQVLMIFLLTARRPAKSVGKRLKMLTYSVYIPL